MTLRRIPDLATRVDAGDLEVADVIAIEGEAVLRVIRNPEGLQAQNDGNYTYQLSREAAHNSLRVLPEEWERLGIKPSKM